MIVIPPPRDPDVCDARPPKPESPFFWFLINVTSLTGVSSTQKCRNYIAADFTDVPYNPNAPDCQQHGNEYCLCAHKAEERATSIKAAGTTISTLFVKPASTATNACPGSASCYPPEKFLAERVASPGLDNTADWNDIDQQVGTLADQIVAKIC